MKDRVRAIIDGRNSTQWDDTNDIYPFLAMGEAECVSKLLDLEQQGKKIYGKQYRHDALSPLISLDPLNTTSIGGTEQEYNLPSNFAATYRASYSNLGSGVLYEAEYLSYEDIKRREEDYFSKARTKSPFYYTRSTQSGGTVTHKIGFFPQPSGGAANMYQHHYYAMPNAITSSQQPTLKPSMHDAIVNYAVALALAQDNNPNPEYYQKFLNAIPNL